MSVKVVLHKDVNKLLFGQLWHLKKLKLLFHPIFHFKLSFLVATQLQLTD